jgi:hypothetical protein
MELIRGAEIFVGAAFIAGVIGWCIIGVIMAGRGES